MNMSEYVEVDIREGSVGTLSQRYKSNCIIEQAFVADKVESATCSCETLRRSSGLGKTQATMLFQR